MSKKKVYLEILFQFGLGKYSSIDDDLLNAITERDLSEHPGIGIRVL